ncbi:hypothetical protein XF36_02780 [Pseudonocardia sp. HH130629-09]|nr:hypothetical protein XF36_02780 [Pseudonocardia sp. HH130629-09]
MAVRRSPTLQATQHHVRLHSRDRFDRADDLRLSGLESDDAPNGCTRWALDVTRPACNVECENGSSASTVRYPRPRSAHDRPLSV